MASPQVENGFVRIANELTREIIRRPFAGNELRILIWVISDSYGWNRKKTAPVLVRKLGRDINMGHTTVGRCIQRLITFGVLKQDEQGRLMLEKNHELWAVRITDTVCDEPASGAPVHHPEAGEGSKSGAPVHQSGAPVHQSGAPVHQKSPDINRSLKDRQDRTIQPGAGAPVHHPASASPTDRPTPERLVKAWNKFAPLTLPRVKILDDWREKKARERLKEHPDLQWWLDLFALIAASKFLQGLGPAKKDGQKPWRCTFDWIITNQHHATKIIEGNYAE